MGVPGLFSYLRKYNSSDDKNSTIKKKIPISNDDQEINLYLDFNAGIYQVIKPEIKTYDSLILYTIQYLDNLVNLFNIPQSNNDDTINRITKLYIAFDGVPPRSKIEQQRMRRYHSVIRKKKLLSLFEEYAESTEKCNINNNIDTNVITPGTSFMEKLSNKIKLHIDNCSYYKYIDVYLNDWTINGEGEHKIFDHIKKNIEISSKSNIKNIIYGLDGDLIMLALSSKLNNIYLLREAYEYGDYAFNHEGYPYLYLDICSLKSSIILECNNFITGPIEYFNNNIDRFIDDYICMMMILGNDFIPKIKWMTIKQNAHQLILEKYFELFNGNDVIDCQRDKQFLYNREYNKINKKMLSDLFRLLAYDENKLSNKFFKKRIKPRIYLSNELSEYEKQKKKLEFFPLKYTKYEINNILPIDNKKQWIYRYYQLCHNIIPSNENIDKIVENYLKIFMWNIHYYLQDYNTCDWDYYYPYNYAPTLTDIYKYLENNNISQIKISSSKHKILTPLELLTIVLPINNKDIMPLQLYNKMTKYKDIFFPQKYYLNIALHTRYYECTPIIPKININLIRQLFKDCKLSPQEKRLNKTENIYISPKICYIP